MSTTDTKPEPQPEAQSRSIARWGKRLIASPWPAALVILGAIGTTWYDVRSEAQADRAAWQAQAQADRAAWQAQAQADRAAWQAESRQLRDEAQADRAAWQAESRQLRGEAQADRERADARFEAIQREIRQLTVEQARLAAALETSQ